MSGLTASLNTELLQLSNEARRKHPEIKEAAERSLIILRRLLKELPETDNISQELAKNNDFLRPFILACETKHVKLITTSIGCLQRLISHHAIPDPSVKTILKTLNDIMSQGVEIQLKILQTVPPLLSNYQALHGDLLAEALLICFRLHDSKIVVVNNTAAATLRQLVINIFEKVQEEDDINNKDGSIKPTSTAVSIHGEGVIALRPCARDAYYLFQDMCLLTNGENPVYLRLHVLSRTFGLELIESVLTNHSRLFKPHPEFCSLLRERVCPLIIKNFSDKFDFPTTMRLMRLVYIILKQFNEILVMECEIFLNMFIKILEPDNPLWQRVISMEIFRGICVDQALLRSIYRSYDKQGHSTNVFREMINAFGKLAAEKPQLLGVGSHSLAGHLHQGRESLEMAGVMGGAGQVDIPGLTISTSIMKVQCFDQLDKVDPPPIPDTYLYYLALFCLNSVADGLHSFVLNILSEVIHKQKVENLNSPPQSPTHVQSAILGTTTLQQLESHPHYKDILLVTDMANTAWPGLLAAQSFFLTANLDEELFQGVLRAYQNFTIVCGVLQLTTPRDAFLTSLCKGAVPPSVIAASLAESKAAHSGSSSTTGGEGMQVVTLSDGNLSCLKILLNIAQYLGGVLGDSWYLILETLQLADFILFLKHARGSRNPRRIGSQHAASNSVTSLPTSQTAGSSSSIQQISSNPPSLKRTYSSNTTNHQANLPGSTSPQQSAIDNDLNILLIQIRKLFDNCKYLDDNALQAFTIALCKLNAYTIGIPLDSENLVAAHDHLSMEGKVTKSTPLNAMRVNRPDEKSFAINKLQLVALINMPRLIAREPSLLWDLIISHLIKTANYVSTPQPIRMQACETIADIVTQAMGYASSDHMEIDERVQMQLLTSLSQLVNNSEKSTQEIGKGFHVEVRKMGLETLNKLLQTSGHSFTYGWSMIFDMIRSVCVISFPNESGEDEVDVSSVDSSNVIDTPSFGVSNTKTSGLVRVAFPCLQLICSDFLSLLSPECLKQCINTLGAFGLQMDDLNISLTAIGLLWNVSDFIQTELEKNFKTFVEEGPENIKEDITVEQEIDQIIQSDLKPQAMNALWMLLLLQLSKICSDTRPEVRNGANQTLFRTIDMNGAVLKTQTWHTCIWKVLFPLLDSVKFASERAVKAMQQQQLNSSAEKLSSPQKEINVFMIHHSRNTIDKQWDETKVLVLTGISDIFKNFVHLLIKLENFEQAWGLLLSHLQDSCLNSSHEVAIAAIKSLNAIIQFPNDDVHTEELKEKVLPLWQTAWIIWERIGLGMITMSDSILRDHLESPSPAEITSIGQTQFTQDTLTAYVVTFGDLYHIIHSKFQIDEIKRLLKVIKGILTYSHSPSYRPDYDYLTPLQEAVLDIVSRIDLCVSGAPAVVLCEFADYINLAFTKKQRDEEAIKKQKYKDNYIGLIHQQKSISGTTSTKGENSGVVMSNNKSYSTVTYIVFSKTSMRKVEEMFKKFVNDQGVYSEGVFARIIKLKYDCPPSGKHVEDIELWKIATTAFLEIVKDGLIALENFGDAISDGCIVDIWKQLTKVLHGALISNSKPPTSIKIDQQDIDEAFDMKFLFRLQSDVMIHMGRPRVPQSLIRDLIKTIQEGSQLYLSDVERQGAMNGYLNKPLPVPVSNGTSFHQKKSKPREKLSEKVEGVTAKIVPVAKERFAYACLQCLFDLCSEDQTGDEEIKQRIAEVAAPILLERCASVIRNYTADQPLLGKVPFPSLSSRVRNDEILLILQQLVKLKFRQNILHVSEEETKSNPLKKQILSGSIAHLFYLYPVVCEAINLPDETIGVLLKECLRKVGEELGVC
ncbi:6201_t:CDS:10 [Funneliformis caledonium]|uniref:6201_t:CDS:1 n=1 Tax=Funneliformis caledonium TaxID=1117310 RepID=A0A9N8V546_9GLOM|nr:6201_t:CDS:10 [Funneliformis caledonium]